MVESTQERELTILKIPELKPGWGQPNWFHHHGMKMKLQREESDTTGVVIRGSAAEVVISSEADPDSRGSARWQVSWKVIQSRGSEDVNGRVLFSEDTLRAAFGLEDTTDYFSHWLIERYGGSAASQGQFLRWGNYLNIPCPGTGNDGDPNVSIELNNDIRSAVNDLLGIPF